MNNSKNFAPVDRLIGKYEKYLYRSENGDVSKRKMYVQKVHQYKTELKRAGVNMDIVQSGGGTIGQMLAKQKDEIDLLTSQLPTDLGDLGNKIATMQTAVDKSFTAMSNAIIDGASGIFNLSNSIGNLNSAISKLPHNTLDQVKEFEELTNKIANDVGDDPFARILAESYVKMLLKIDYSDDLSKKEVDKIISIAKYLDILHIFKAKFQEAYDNGTYIGSVNIFNEIMTKVTTHLTSV